MTTSDWITIVILVLVLGYMVFTVERDHRRRSANPYVVPVEEPKAEPPLTQALEVDMSNPPRTRVYEPKGAATARCTCHDRRLEPGEEILWWPQPDGSVLVICKESTIR